MAESIDYDYQPEGSGGTFLSLRKRGDTVKIRLASKPVHFKREYEGKEREKFAWLVIDRADGKVKVFTSSVSIYLMIKGMHESADWGDPTKYDLTITRTEESTANYYRVMPSPNKSELTKEEQKAVKDSGLDLGKLFADSKATNTFGEEPPPVEATVTTQEVSGDIPL